MSDHEADGDWDNLADGSAPARASNATLRSSRQAGKHQIDGMPAMVYLAFWQQKIDGRFHKVTKGVSAGQSITILFDMVDFPPAALMTIENGDYKVEPVGNPSMLAIKPSAVVRGRMVDAMKLLDGLGAVLVALITGKFKIKGIRKLFVLLKVLMAKEVDTT